MHMLVMTMSHRTMIGFFRILALVRTSTGCLQDSTTHSLTQSKENEHVVFEIFGDSNMDSLNSL
jgi:hypothetical protein